MLSIKGEDVVLITSREIGRDAFNRAIVETSEEVVHDVLIAPNESDDLITNTDLVSRKATYTLAIPKGDAHTWENMSVRFWGKTFHVYGKVLESMNENTPTRWNKKVTVELYE